MGVDPTPEALAPWIPKEMQNSKQHAKHTIPWWVFSQEAKMNQVLGQTLALDHVRMRVRRSSGR